MNPHYQLGKSTARPSDRSDLDIRCTASGAAGFVIGVVKALAAVVISKRQLRREGKGEEMPIKLTTVAAVAAAALSALGVTGCGGAAGPGNRSRQVPAS
jgi:hypothetical protein